MKRSFIISCLLAVFSWNALFGAFDGLLLCLHQDLALHVEAHDEVEADCSIVEDECLNEADDCVDLSLNGELLPPSRLDEAFGIALELPVADIAPFERSTTIGAAKAPTELRCPRGPPVVAAISLLSTKTVRLRL